MFKALLRLLSMVLLSVSVIMAVLDATRSIAAEAIVLTPLGASWEALSPATLEQFRSLVTANLPDFVWNEGVAALLALPGFAIFALLALLVAFAGRRSSRREGFAGLAR